MNKVAIVDYGMCNLDSVRRAVEECGGQAIVTDQPADIEAADRIILPGVGAFPDAMRNLTDLGLHKVLEDQVLGEGAPFLGICLGMQLLASMGFEGAETPGLDWIEGDVRRLVPTDGERVPHVGWNEIVPSPGSPLFHDVKPGTDFYFVHSYHYICRNDDDVAATTPYCGGFTSAVGRGNVFAVQFHPEKSQRNGFQVLRNFLAF